MRRPGHDCLRFLLASLLLTATLAAAQGKDVSYAHGADTVHGVLFAPAGRGPFPALLAIHAVFGLDDWTKEQATRLEDAGYVVLAVDLHAGKVANGLGARPAPQGRRRTVRTPLRRPEDAGTDQRANPRHFRREGRQHTGRRHSPV